MIDILIVSLAWDYEMTGPNIRTFSLAKYIAKQGKKVKVTMINNRESKIIDKYEILGLFSLHFFCFERIKEIKGLTSVATLIAEIPYSIQIFHLIKKYKPRIILIEETQSATPLLIGLKLLCKLYRIRPQIFLDKHNVLYHLISSFSNEQKNNIQTVVKSLNRLLERIGILLSDKIITVSEIDKELIKKLYETKKDIFIIPNGVDLEKFKPNDKEGKIVKKRLGLLNKKIVLFLGGLNYLPNLDATKVFINKILPNVKKKIPNCVFLVVGRCPKEIYEKYKNDSSIIFTGFVEDEVPYINAADICVAPLRMGSGTRIKILSYMACGKPVISTYKGAEGLKLEDRKDIIISEISDFADSINYIFNNPYVMKSISRNGRNKVRNLYSWDIVTRNLLKKIHGIYL